MKTNVNTVNRNHSLKIEELPDSLRKTVRCLKNGSLSIEADVIKALENAEDLKLYGIRSHKQKEVIENVKNILT